VLAGMVGLGEGRWNFCKLAVSLVVESTLVQPTGMSWVSRNTVCPTRSGTAAAAEVVASAYAVATDAATADRATTADTAAWSTGVAVGTASTTDAAVTEAAHVVANATAATDTVPADIIFGSLMMLHSARCSARSSARCFAGSAPFGPMLH
jgi:hypothetical protein